MKRVNRISVFQVLAKRKILFFLALLGLLSTSFILPAEEVDHLKIRKVVIDAGHGGKDPGNLGTGRYKVTEKDIALDVSLLVGGYIKENFPDVEVIYTRDTDVFLELKERTVKANDSKADLFISIHCNSHSNASAYGTETFVMGMHKTEANLKVAQKENSVIFLEENYEQNYEGFDPNSPESIIALSLVQSQYMSQSISLSQKVQDQFKNRVQRKDRGVRQAGFWVISYTAMPSILVELGFLTNPDEEDFLNSVKGKEYMASAIYRAFRDYKNDVEGINNAANGEAENEGETTPQPAPDPVKEEVSEKSVASESSESSGSKKDYEVTITTNTPKEEEKAIEFSAEHVRLRVQIVTSSQPIELKASNFKGLEDVRQYMSNGLFKYTVGNETSLTDAKKIQERVRKSGYGGAFIVAFHKNVRIDLKKALTLLHK